MIVISKDMVHDAIRKELVPSNSNKVPERAPVNFTIKLNDLDYVNISITDWIPSANGSVKMSATISKN